MNHTGGMRLRATGAALAGYVGGDREAINQHFHQSTGTDEAGQVLVALDEMQAKLRRLKEEELNAAATVSGHGQTPR